MSCWQEGEQDEARRWLAKATAWVLAHSASAELKKVYEEATRLVVYLEKCGDSSPL